MEGIEGLGIGRGIGNWERDWELGEGLGIGRGTGNWERDWELGEGLGARKGGEGVRVLSET